MFFVGMAKLESILKMGTEFYVHIYKILHPPQMLKFSLCLPASFQEKTVNFKIHGGLNIWTQNILINPKFSKAAEK